ncbi:MAG: hypothetical protein HQL26_03805 [Candidatus Omnitrophica bacterium]|nr:hypothetical protein [Candidatus Omnitrophota bacterium]
MIDELKSKLDQIIKPVLDEMGLEIFLFAMNEYRNEITIDLVVDKPAGGITVEECGRLNRRLIQVIDEGGIITTGYTVGVCSPGLDWPLKVQRDFKRAMGRNVMLYLSQPLDGKVQYDGKIVEAGEQNVKIDFNGETKEVPYDVINKGMEIIE